MRTMHQVDNMTETVKACAEVIERAETVAQLKFVVDTLLHAQKIGNISREEVKILSDIMVDKYWSTNTMI